MSQTTQCHPETDASTTDAIGGLSVEDESPLARERAERLRLEEALRQREWELTEAHRIAGIGTWRYDCATDTTTWSEEVYRIYAWDRDEPLPPHSACRTVPDPSPSEILFTQAFDRALETGEPYALDLEITARDGTKRWIATRGEVDQWVDGRVGGKVASLRGTVLEITERKRVEEECRQATERLKGVLESITDGICVLDRDLTYIYFNENGARMCGLRASDIIGTRVGDTFAENRTNLISRMYRHSLETGEPVHVEEYSIAPLDKWFESNCYPSADGLTVYFRDITERKRTEQALRESEQRFRLLAETLPELVWVSDPFGSLSYLNERFMTYCGIPPDAVVGFDWGQIVHPEELERVLGAWTHSVQSGEPYLIELQLRAHDMSFRHFLARALPMRGASGEVERWVGSCTDIHDQKLAEEALRRSEKLAATGRLAASIAHEINNPLSSVTNLLYLARLDASVSPETRGYLESAEQELARVTHITTQTLRFHRQSKSAAVADLPEIMRSVLVLFRSRFASRRIEVVGEFGPDARIRCFADELRQVFTNLVSNSFDATPDGGMLRIRIRRAVAHGVSGLRVTVADTGCGIPVEIQRRIFEPFFSTKDATGIGLGLWVSDGILKKHEARLSFRSRTAAERHGTVFSLFFPEGVALL
jgi:PAS domain S-box-containing protein